MSGALSATASSSRSAVRIRAQTIVLGALAAAAVVSVIGMAKILLANPDLFGIDLPAYVEAARRLLASGSPYSPQLLSGVLDRYDIATGYLYPPPLAQLFVPLSVLPMSMLAPMWALAQGVGLLVMLPMVFLRFGGTRDRTHIAAVILAAVGFFPNLMAIVIGNVSGWIAIGIAVMLLATPAVRSTVAATAMWVKLTPGIFAIGAFVDRSSRWSAAAAALAIAAASFALAPAAWRDWVVVFPLVSGFFGDVPFTSNLAPAHVLRSTGFGSLGTVAAILVPAAFAIAVLLHARRGNLAAWVTAGTGVYLSATGTSWDHYFVALSPVAAAAWPGAPRALRVVIVAVLVWYGPLRFLETQALYQLVGLASWLAMLVVAVAAFGKTRIHSGLVLSPADGG